MLRIALNWLAGQKIGKRSVNLSSSHISIHLLYSFNCIVDLLIVVSLTLFEE